MRSSSAEETEVWYDANSIVSEVNLYHTEDPHPECCVGCGVPEVKSCSDAQCLTTEEIYSC